MGNEQGGFGGDGGELGFEGFDVGEVEVGGCKP